MKKLLIISGVMLAFASSEASAQLSIQATIGEPVYAEPYPEPGYVVAPDWPSQHYDIHRHRHNDYWAHHNPRAAHEEHRDHR